MPTLAASLALAAGLAWIALPEPLTRLLQGSTQEDLAHLRATAAEFGRERARELLRAQVAALAEPSADEAAEQLELLRQLDAAAEELGCLRESLRLRELALAAQRLLRAADHPDVLRAMGALAAVRKELGDGSGARELCEAELAAWLRRPDAEAVDLLRVRALRAALELGTQDPRRSLATFGDLHEEAQSVLPADHPLLLAAMSDLAWAKSRTGDPRGAQELREAVLAAAMRVYPVDHLEVLRARRRLAASREQHGDLDGALALQEAGLEACLRLLPEDHPEVFATRNNLAGTRQAVGNLAGARELQEAVLAGRRRLLPADHPDTLMAMGNLASTLGLLGELKEARKLQESVLEIQEQRLSPDHPDLLQSMSTLAGTCWRLGDMHRAYELMTRVVDVQSRELPEDHRDLLRSLQGLALATRGLGKLHEAERVQTALLAALARQLPPDDPQVLVAKQNLAVTRLDLDDTHGALPLLEEVHEAWKRRARTDQPELLKAMGNLALAKRRLGDPHGALELAEAGVEGWKRRVPPDHPDLLHALGGLARIRRDLGDLEGARELQESLVEAWSRRDSPEHSEYLQELGNLAETLEKLGDLRSALELLERALEVQRRRLSPDHADLLAAMGKLASLRLELGNPRGAHELRVAIRDARERRLPADHPDVLGARARAAWLLIELGDPWGAREELEAVLEARRRVLAPDHPHVLDSLQDVGFARYALGDYPGARAYQEAGLEGYSRRFPADHSEVGRAKANLALTLLKLGEHERARTLQEELLESATRRFPPERGERRMAAANLALTLRGMGDAQGARELQEHVLEIERRLFPPDHPGLLRGMANLAITLRALGELEEVRELQEVVLERQGRILQPDHPALLAAMSDLARTRHELGDGAGARELVLRTLAHLRLRARALGAEGLRSAREGARAELERFATLLALGSDPDAGGELERELLATLESLRAVSQASADVAHAIGADATLAELSTAIAAARSRLNDLAAAGPRRGQDPEAWRLELHGLAEERDRAERLLRQRLAERGTAFEELDARAVAKRLDAQAAVVSFLRYHRRFEPDQETGVTPPAEDALLAFVLRPDGAVRRLELGSTRELDALVQDWRLSLGKPLEGRLDRGLAPRAETVASAGEHPDERTSGRTLRARLLDPLLGAAGEGVRRLHVVPDDSVFLVPLDALPLDGDGRVGERISIHVEPSLARLLRGGRAPVDAGRLVVLGGVDFDGAALAEAADERAPEDLPSALRSAALPPGERTTRAARFEPLEGTRGELAMLAEQYRQAWDAKPVTLEGSAATKAALFGAAPDARFLHLATHGWFAGESFHSALDPEDAGEREALQRAEATRRGFAPETLCGLALAGANRGRDEDGRVRGILTAEELASLDLRGCELAVLSACETNVGIRRAGQGIQSLQSALHAAGARSAITSLWKVDDEATRRLFERFYAQLWGEQLGKAEALWQAKQSLRAEGFPLRDWAAWVLSGAPE
ncbi:MAG: CHAT domain-containing protein [Planctomycetes bacterium]|nr:CHAT domain-containing protein [Planctomycetota bacterium]